MQSIESVIVLLSSILLCRASQLWINTTYQAEDVGIDFARLPQCIAWNIWWKLQEERIELDLSSDQVDLLAERMNNVTLRNSAELRRYKLPSRLLRDYQVVHINFEQICRNHSRIFWISTATDAKKYHLNTIAICEPYKQKFHPTLDDMSSAIENEIDNTTDFENIISEDVQIFRVRRKADYDIEPRNRELEKRPSVSLVSVFNTTGGVRRVDSSLLVDKGLPLNESSSPITHYQLEVDEKEKSPVVIVEGKHIAESLRLNISTELFDLHQGIGIVLGPVCGDAAPELLYSHDHTLQNEILQSHIGIDFSLMGMDIDELAMTLRNDIQLNNIMRLFDEPVTERQPHPSAFIIPVLNNTHYDPRTPPALFAGQAVDVRIGIHVQSMSNFQLTTMDYDMDVWLRMAWRDPRLAHGSSRPILISEESFLRKLWRPDPFIGNAKQALFQRVTFPNMYMFVFADGLVFYETRLYLRPSCQLVLCKYPHDKQTCSVRISSLAFTQDIVQFHWFTRVHDAIRKNRNVQLPELYITNYSKHQCNGLRKSGNFTCVEARFHMKRSLGYHLGQTYVPTAMCVVFSWISVWLPEEFVDGRVFVSLTVFLTLSAESNSAKEILPKVSYMKAIDVWYGFTAIFVFSTMLQTLVVITFENKSRTLRKEAEASAGKILQYQLMKIMLKSKLHHKMASRLDTYCKILYPVVFMLFLIIYYFVITEGEETKCLRQ